MPEHCAMMLTCCLELFCKGCCLSRYAIRCSTRARLTHVDSSHGSGACTHAQTCFWAVSTGIHNYDYACSFRLGVVIISVVILTVSVAAAAAAATIINMVYGCCYNQACITGTIMTACMILDNFTVTVTTVSVLLCHQYHHHFCLSRRQGNAFLSCCK